MATTKGARKTTESPEVTADEAKGSLGELLSRVGFGKERIPITRHGKRIAALVSADDLALLENSPLAKAG